VCLTGALSLRDGKSHCDETLCKICGVCAQVCPQKAITITVENIEATINELLGRINDEVGGLPVNSYQGFKALK
jgi:Fe-S-cluster-containing hydrogenase component 2